MTASDAALQPSAQETNAILIAEMQAGREEAFERFVGDFGGQALAVARRFFRCEEECADAVQDAFLSAFQSLGTFRGDSRLGTWLHRIVVNACLMRLRRRKRTTMNIDDLLPQFVDDGHHAAPVTPWNVAPLEQVCSAELRDQVRNCIDQLPDSYRTVLLLRDIDEFDTATTADLLGISESLVKVRLHRARQALRTLLEPHVCD